MNCPKCNAEIDHLIEWSSENTPYEYRIGDDGKEDWIRSTRLEPEPLEAPTTYSCPECCEDITCTKEEAQRLLGFTAISLN